MTLMEQLSAYIPYNEQEARDRALLLECLRREPDVMTRQNPLAHFTASAWIVNPTRTRVLMVYHNIYHSWSWLGGHADGESDLLAVAMREAREESGIRSARPVSEDIFSLGGAHRGRHEKRGASIVPPAPERDLSAGGRRGRSPDRQARRKQRRALVYAGGERDGAFGGMVLRQGVS